MAAPASYPPQQISYPRQQLPANPTQPTSFVAQPPGYTQQQPGYPQQQVGYPQPGYQQQYAQAQPVAYGVPQPLGGPGQTTVYQAGSKPKKLWPNYNSTASRVLGWSQVAVAFFSIVFNAVGIHMQRGRNYSEENGGFYASGGFWSSAFFFISGGFAIGAAKHKTSCMIITNMVMSIIAAIFGLGLLGTSAAAVGVENSDVIDYSQEDFSSRNRLDDNAHKVSLAMASLMLLLSFIGIICAIWSSAICCAAVCCGRAIRSRMDVTTVYGAQVTQQAYPAGQQPPLAGQQLPLEGQQPPPAGQQPPPASQQPPPVGQQPPPVCQQPSAPAGYGYTAPRPEPVCPTYQAGGYGAAPSIEPIAPPSYESTVASDEKTSL